MKNVLEYKGYLTRIEYSVEDKVLYGKIEGIKDLVNFESSSVEQIVDEFHCAVDDYLSMCEELGESPDKAYSGTFNVRIKPELHRRLAMCAYRAGETLNCTVEKAIEAFTNDATNQRLDDIWQAISSTGTNYANMSNAMYSTREPWNNTVNLKVIAS